LGLRLFPRIEAGDFGGIERAQDLRKAVELVDVVDPVSLREGDERREWNLPVEHCSESNRDGPVAFQCPQRIQKEARTRQDFRRIEIVRML
jgi:hypothetical protein